MRVDTRERSMTLELLDSGREMPMNDGTSGLDASFRHPVDAGRTVAQANDCGGHGLDCALLSQKCGESLKLTKLAHLVRPPTERARSFTSQPKRPPGRRRERAQPVSRLEVLSTNCHRYIEELGA